MSRIESRPSKREMGEYIFFVDLEFSSSQQQEEAGQSLERALEGLRPLCEHLVLFGAYPITNLAEEG